LELELDELELLGVPELDELLLLGAGDDDELELGAGPWLLEDAATSGAFGLLLSQAMDIPPTATAPTIIFRNSRRFSRSGAASVSARPFLLRRSIPPPSTVPYADAAKVRAGTRALPAAVVTRYSSIRRITSSAVMRSMHRGKSPTGSTHSSPGRSFSSPSPRATARDFQHPPASQQGRAPMVWMNWWCG
jgi:hypothetical protein